MTLRDLLTFFERYYGEKYSGIVLDTMTSYLNDFSDEFYQAAAKVMIKRFSRAYTKAPSPAEIEKHMDEILATIPPVKSLPAPEISDAERAEGSKFFEDLKLRFSQKQEKWKKPLRKLGFQT